MMKNSRIKLILLTLMIAGLALCIACTSPEAPTEGSETNAATEENDIKTKPAADESTTETQAIGAKSDEKPEYGDWLIRNLSTDPTILNPVLSTDLYATYVQSLIFDAMIDIDKDLNFIPRVAKSWEISEDKLSYIFHLREDVKFSDGVPLTSADVKFTYDMIIHPEVPALNKKADYEKVEKVEAPDPYTIKVTYKEPYSPGLESWGMLILPKHIYEAEDIYNGFVKNEKRNREPIGSGPYKFVKWDTAQEIVLETNENYWDRKPYIDKVIFRIIPEQSTSFQALKTGDLDIDTLSAVQWEQESNSPEFLNMYNKLKYYTMGFSYIGWNADGSNPFFTDARVRRAMTYALNRKSILENIYKGLGKLATGPFYPLSWAHDNSIEPYPFDLDKAEELLDEAGWKFKETGDDGYRYKDGKKFSFEMIYVKGASSTDALLTTYKNDLDEIGVEMKLKPLEWTVFIEEHVHKFNFEATIQGWSLSIDPDPYLIWHSSQRGPGLNYVAYNNPEVDRLCEEGRKEFDIEKRRKMYHRIHQILHDEQPYTFLFFRPSLVAVNKRFRNVEPSPQGVYMYYPGMTNWFVPKSEQKYY